MYNFIFLITISCKKYNKDIPIYLGMHYNKVTSTVGVPDSLNDVNIDYYSTHKKPYFYKLKEEKFIYTNLIKNEKCYLTYTNKILTKIKC
jgi:hypothetical protein